MSGFQGPGPAVHALVDRLSTDLAGHVAQVNSEYEDDLAIPDVDARLVYPYMPTIGELNQFPAIGVEHGPGELEDDIGSSATEVYDLSVVVFVQSAQQDILSEYARRTLVAVVRCVMQDRNLGSGPGIPWGVTCRKIDPGPALTSRTSGDEGTDPAPPKAYMTWVALTVRVKSDWD